MNSSLFTKLFSKFSFFCPRLQVHPRIHSAVTDLQGTCFSSKAGANIWTYFYKTILLRFFFIFFLKPYSFSLIFLPAFPYITLYVNKVLY